MIETTKRIRRSPWKRSPIASRPNLRRRAVLLPPLGQSKTATPGEEKDTLKIIPLGGLGEIGKNMSLLEYKDDILVIDAGFKFPDEDHLGIDYIIPNTEYLERKRQNIRGLVLTHGHMDHIGAIPYLIEKLGNPDVYGGALTRGIVAKRHEEFVRLPKLKFHIVKADDVVRFGDFFEVEFFHVNHNIPDDLALFIKTPAGNVVHTADFKFDHSPTNGQPIDVEHLRELGKRGVAVLMIDSTGAEREGHSISEKTIMDNMELIFRESKQMIVFGTFASMIDRIQQIIWLSEKYGRKVVFEGYSMKSNVEIAKELAYIKMQKDTQIASNQVNDYPRSKITVIATGAQGQSNAALMRIANHEHRFIRLIKKDSLIFSSSTVPGNERAVQNLKDMFYRAGMKVYHYQMMDIHAGGHAQKEDLGHMMEVMNPKFLMPIHGQYSMMVSNSEIAQSKGIPEENVIMADNGSVVHIWDPAKGGAGPQTISGSSSPTFGTKEELGSGDLKQDNVGTGTFSFDKRTVPSNPILVDGLGIGDVGNVVLRDRQVLSEDGMFVIVILIDTKNGKVMTSPDIISRGFIYLKDNKDLLAQVRKKARFVVEKSSTVGRLDTAYLKDNLREEIGRFLFQKTEKRPMVLPVIIEV